MEVTFLRQDIMDGHSDDSLKIRIRKARAKFLAMAATYSAGVLNDNFFRQTVLMLAVLASKTNLQAVATVLFNLPFTKFVMAKGCSYSIYFVCRPRRLLCGPVQQAESSNRIETS